MTKQSTYVYRCDWNTQGDRCDAQSPPSSDYYAIPVGWSTFDAKIESQKTAGPFHFCPAHTELMFDDIVSDWTLGHPEQPERHPEVKANA